MPVFFNYQRKDDGTWEAEVLFPGNRRVRFTGGVELEAQPDRGKTTPQPEPMKS